MFKPFFLTGSKSSHFNHSATDSHPFPTCPESPNCIRISKPVPLKTENCWQKITAVFEKMRPLEIEKESRNYRLKAVFQVVIFKDDFCLELENLERSTIIHIRSSSREGYSDLGINRRRVKRFLRLLDITV